MHVHVLQHAPFEGLGCIAGWLAARGARVTTTRLDENPSLPPPTGHDLIVAMGGPMSVNDEAALPWLRDEKQFLREAIRAGVPVLGVCLGAQLIAGALGARVTRNAQKEIGWFPVTAVPAEGDAFRFPDSLRVFHWHGETFALPDGAVHLARSAACEHQAFQYGRRVLALQFHLEVTPDAARGFVENGGDELVPAPFVQTAAEILAAPPADYAAAQACLHRALDHLTA